MNEQAGADLLKAAAALFDAFAWQQAVPTLMLVAMFMAGVALLKSAALREGFDGSEFFRDETSRKLSTKKLLAMGCFMTHSWVITSAHVAKTLTFNDMALYCLTWSGSIVLLEALSVVRGVYTPKAQ